MFYISKINGSRENNYSCVRLFGEIIFDILFYIIIYIMKTRNNAKNHLKKTRSKKQRGGVTAEQQEKDKRLLQAVDINDPDKVSEALDAGANINTLGAFGNTALLIASKNGYPEVVARLLSDKGVNRNVMNRYGDTAFSWANYNKDNHKKTLKLITQHIVEQPLPNIKKTNKTAQTTK
jgi:ankyrin repeat protein